MKHAGPCIRRTLEPVEPPLGQVLFEPGAPPSHVVFQTTAVVSLLHVAAPDAMVEIAVVGNEGVVGVALTMGAEAAACRAVVKRAGHGLRLDGRALRATLPYAPKLLLMRYAQALIMQMAQAALSPRKHSFEQQMCRWLLLSLDRLHGNELVTTRTLLSALLGARQPDVAAAAQILQGPGLIRDAPDRIAVLDRPGLTQRTCGCYAAVRDAYDRLRPARTSQ